ncbi:hypothetical protein AB0B79_06220 [Streptomyces sp. NPDC039022]|uniref:hypothetical protein n=1 Tax=Streptomyces sp. NPDC039022 TaxID=3157091 RepID=UPI0033C97167
MTMIISVGRWPVAASHEIGSAECLWPGQAQDEYLPHRAADHSGGCGLQPPSELAERADPTSAPHRRTLVRAGRIRALGGPLVLRTSHVPLHS